MALLGSADATASTALSSSRLAIGINVDGSLVTEDRSLGIRYDPGGGASDAPMGLDMVLPGYPFETWTADWNGGRQTNGGPHLEDGIPLTWGSPVDNGFVNGVDATGTVGPLDVKMSYDLAWDVDILWIEMTVTARNAVSNLWIARTVDPDPDATFSTYVSVNAANNEVVTSAARYSEKAMALAASGGIAGLCNNWCTRPSTVVNGADESATDDQVVGVAVEVGDLAAGESRTLWFTYGFGLDAAEAEDMALWGLDTPDRDGDGLTEDEGDCDDRDPATNPTAQEFPDGLDNNCDGQIDEGTSRFDDDGDGFTEDAGDCDDANPLVYPGAPATEGVADADCDGEADDGSWTREENRPEGWGEDTGLELELVKGGCSSVGTVGLTPWFGALLFFGYRRRGGVQ